MSLIHLHLLHEYMYVYKHMYVNTPCMNLRTSYVYIRTYVHMYWFFTKCNFWVYMFPPYSCTSLLQWDQKVCMYIHSQAGCLHTVHTYVRIYCTLYPIPYSWCLVCGVHYGRTAHQTGHLSWKWSYPHPVKCMSVCTYVCAYLCQVLQCILIRINMHT
jgi:hypothetical protein